MDAEREAEIQSFFSCDVDFPYPKDKHSFEDLLEQFKSRSNTTKLNETDSTELDLYKSSFWRKKKVKKKNVKEIDLMLWTTSLV